MATPPTFTVGQVLTAAQMNAVGMWKMTPTSVANATISNGTVIPNSGVSTVTINGVFTSDFANYVISWSGMGASVGGSVLYAKLCIAGTPQTSGWYGNTFFIAAGAAGGLSNATLSNAAFTEIGSLTSTSGHFNTGVANIQSPQLAAQTRCQFTNADDYYFRTGAYHLSNTTQYDGIQLLAASGTLSGGKIRIYGLRD